MADDTYSRGYRNDPHDRGGAGASGPATDPLTELARLIGQSDPFAPDRSRQPDPRQPDPFGRSANRRAGPAQYDQQHYDTGAQDQRYDTDEPQRYTDTGYGSQQRYTDNGYGSDEDYASQQDGYADRQAARHESGHGEPQLYHPDQHPYRQEPQSYQDEPAYPPALPGYTQAQPAHHASDAPERGEYEDQQGAYGAPPFFARDPNSRPDDYHDDAPARRRGWLVTAAALVGLAVVGTAGAFAYRSVFAGGEARIITRDMGPSKIAPAPANQDAANKSDDRLASGGQNERLGPPPEQPMPIPDPPHTVTPAITQSQPPAPTGDAAPVLPPPAAPSQADLLAEPAGNGAAPRKVRTEKIKPDQLSDALAAHPAAPGAPRTITPSLAQPRTATTTSPPPSNAPLSLAPQGVPDAAAPAAAAAPRVHTTAVAPPPAPTEHGSGGSGYYVQVSAHKSEDEAKSSFRDIAARHASLLGGHEPVIRRKDLGSKGIFYGAQVGPLSREEAAKLCEDLKAAGQSCMVQRN